MKRSRLRRKTPWKLSPREHEVLGFCLRGVDLISQSKLSKRKYSTIRNQAATMMKKLGAHTLLEAVAIASGRRVVPASSTSGVPEGQGERG